MASLLQMTGPVMDLTYRVKALPASGQEAGVTGFSMSPGGGFNLLAAARAAGMEARLGGTRGTGPFASLVAKELEALGIACARNPLADMDQGCCTVLLEPDGERSFIGWPGAEGQVTAEALGEIDLDGVTWVTLSGYSIHYPGSREALAAWIAALPAQIQVMFDPSPKVSGLSPAFLDPMLKRADWISANLDEAAFLTGTALPDQAARILSENRAGALVRLGAQGSILATEGHCHKVPSHKVEVLDTNGAGDCHIGSFVAELSLSGDPLRAARYANIAAALSVTRSGPATPPKRREVLAHL
ncbi:PfkB family carbohydrate kinase [Roseibium aggregatum]|uniref:Ribokinase n=1 Tax=Roseibium aggregatum TaxID=187304 RepID=A0A939J5Y5_9HYPH|nr:PfkB family carbohydrate kinase [Roseibium aggregatum]MBN9672224.1 ribokinase [Roseibium aggregatum]